MQKSAMKWDDLRVFLALARHGRLLNAGRTLGLDPAARQHLSLCSCFGRRPSRTWTARPVVPLQPEIAA